jgi:hypothetical protein
MKSQIISKAAAIAVLGLDQGSNNRPGELYIANESRFVEANFSQPLTTFATGWRDPNNIEATLEFLAPAVETSRRFEFAQFGNSEEFLSEADDVRAIGSSFKRVEFTGEKVNAKTLNKGLTIRVDHDNVAGMPNWREVYTGRIMRRLLRNELRRAAAVLDAAATSVGHIWSTAAGKDPDQDVADTALLYTDATGITPTRLLYGPVAWNLRRKSHRAQDIAGAYLSASRSVGEVATELGFREGLVAHERYQSSASAKTKIIGDSVYLYTAEAGQTPEDPSNIKRFVSPAEGGSRFRVYEQQVNAKLTDITVEHYSVIIATSTLGIRKMAVTAS